MHIHEMDCSDDLDKHFHSDVFGIQQALVDEFGAGEAAVYIGHELH